MRIISVGASDIGRRRALNEDSYFRDDGGRFYVVADGVGGHSKGEIASAEAVEQLRMWVYGTSGAGLADCLDRAETSADARWEVRRLLESGVQSACYMVFSMAEVDPNKRGMSTTMSALLIGGGFAFAAHVGDSRVYRIRRGEVLQMTEDHTLINYKLKQGLISADEAERATGKHIITRAVGHKDYVQVDTADVDVAPGDRFLLCTDGLHQYFDSDRDVAELVGDDSLDACVQAAIGLANQRGGKDNITCVLVDVLP